MMRLRQKGRGGRSTMPMAWSPKCLTTGEIVDLPSFLMADMPVLEASMMAAE
jgi:hypothetical protein